MKYRIIVADSPHSLENQVNRLLKEAWRVQGGISVVSIPASGMPTDTIYYQAMTKGIK